MGNSNSLDLQMRLSRVTIFLPNWNSSYNSERGDDDDGDERTELRRSSMVPHILSSHVLDGGAAARVIFSCDPFTKVACIHVVEMMAVHTTAHMSACGHMRRRLLLYCA